MNNGDYITTQESLLTLARLVTLLDLDAFLQRIERANALGPIYDPTLYREAADNLNKIRRLGQAANVFRKEALAQLGVASNAG